MNAQLRNPYVGPRTFEAAERSLFFGREREGSDLLSLVTSARLILFYAQSGAGKSSLINTTLLPALQEEGYEVLPVVRISGNVPANLEVENIYIYNLINNLAHSEIDPQALKGFSLAKYLGGLHCDENGLVIIIDQFEELFTTHPEAWEKRTDFFKQLSQGMQENPLISVVLVMREDYIASLDPYSRLLPDGLRVRYRLERLTENAALHAIKDPLANTDRTFAPDVAEELVKELLAIRTIDAKGGVVEIEGQYVEPLQLQVVCATLWSTLAPDVTEIQKIHLKDFDVNSALSLFYESAIESAVQVTGVREANLRNWFEKILITPMGTRNTVFRGEESTGGIENSVVDFLESRHIIRAEYRAGIRWYEMTHDRMIEPILESNRNWFNMKRSPLQRQADVWNNQGRNRNWLLTDQALLEAELWAGQNPDDLTPDEIDFLEVSREMQARTDRMRNSARVSRGMMLISTLMIIVLFTFIFIEIFYSPKGGWGVFVNILLIMVSFTLGSILGPLRAK